MKSEPGNHREPIKSGPLISATGLRKEYPGVVALGDINVELLDRSFVCLLGPSGCGKSTLLEILAGLQSPTSGAITYRGHRIRGPVRDMIYVFQQYDRSLFPWLKVLDNVIFGLRVREGITRDEMIERGRKYLDLVGLGKREDSYPWQLSGGMQQRVAIARALVCEPRVLLMDEPFGAVDALTRSDLQDLILKVWEKLGLTILFVTHDVDEAVYLGQRVVIFSPAPGRIVYDKDVTIEYPRSQLRTRASSDFLEYRRQALECIRAGK